MVLHRDGVNSFSQLEEFQPRLLSCGLRRMKAKVAEEMPKELSKKRDVIAFEPDGIGHFALDRPQNCSIQVSGRG